MHITDKPGSFVTFKFNGTAVWYVTDYYPDHGLVNITLDGGPGELVNGRSSSNAAVSVSVPSRPFPKLSKKLTSFSNGSYGMQQT
jgi:hypothetical protein